MSYAARLMRNAPRFLIASALAASAWFFGAARSPLWQRITALFIVLGMPVAVVWPWLVNTSTFGFHDWDVMTSHRYLVVKSLVEFGEFPGWNPYACGGFPAWGYVEGGTTVVSPWLPFYLLFDIRVALRIEVLGYAFVAAFGTWFAAGRFLRQPLCRALVVVLFAVNGRWGLQTASGHGWHLAYGLLPWALYYFDDLLEPRIRARSLFGLASVFALLVYAGGIYPLPHTVLALGLYAIGMAIVQGRLRPLYVYAVGGLFGVLLSLPKLLPVLATFHRAPRIIASTESLDLGAFITLLVSRDQAFYARPAAVRPYGWHEWGMYISLAGLIIVAAGLLFTRGKRESVLKLIGATFLILGFGAFAPFAPWTWLHEHVPVFRSQHVPSRFLYPAILFLGIVGARLIEDTLPLLRARAGQVIEWAFALGVVAIAVDVSHIAQKPMRDAMWMIAPEGIRGDTPFGFAVDPPFQYETPDWAGPMYLAMLGNTGVIRCYGTPPFEEIGALARSHRRYRGEVEISSGLATLDVWSPNRAAISLSNVSEPATLVYNMNFDSGFRAEITQGDGRVVPARVFARGHRVAVDIPPGARALVISYSPPGLFAGCVAALVALATFGVWARLRGNHA
jgi:hypothetical protein